VARSETIIGKAVTVGDKTVIPVVKITFGFGAGGGQRDKDKTDEYGGGGGGGAKIEPAAFIIMDDKGIRLLPAGKGKWDTIIEAIPGFARKVSDWTDKFKSEEGEGKGKGKDDSEPSDDSAAEEDKTKE